MEIMVDDLSGPEVAALLEEHLRGMAEDTPPESVHALDLAGLKRPEITFWSAWDGKELMGCGALKDLGGGHGELKSMRTAAAHLRKGVAAGMLAHIVAEARSRGFERLSLETGSPDSFIPARKLYEKFGFEYCGPFADYEEDPYSVFMTMAL
ncbi:GNAT family N-acetyltransferase [Cohnella ginsengisoli]|uniref:GNAT family N-acetyltransferase n=1 Tax=Cohnella ginsengisoli TaxID=425004 RepID=A0A9X4KL33_9BACL|nr:GNAT family N-acetyltransferase [Cohnella ginsengisoli]MDG0791610.1 GNAT family N-acetyltransferase [Cohnella ginsengisoli]